MYYPHFGLKEPPFKITPNTDFFFSGGNRGAILDALVYAITNGEGIIKVVGEVGSGKTMLCRMLQTILPEKIESIYLANPSVAPEDVLHAIAFELQLKLPKNADRLKVMQELQAHLLSRHAEGRQVVIFVEEAQGMPLATLEEIRLLSNLETKQDKLLQIVLFGQPELDENLNQENIRQLRERITHRFNLGPLQTKDVGEYLIFRLRAAGYHGPHLFNEAAIKKLSAAAKGLVRRVNVLADKALLAAFAEDVYQVTPKHIKAAIQDSEFGVSLGLHQSGQYKKYAIWAVLLMTMLGLGFLAATLLNKSSQHPSAISINSKPVNKTGISLVQQQPVKKLSVNAPVAAEANNVNLNNASSSTSNLTPSVPLPSVAIETPKTIEMPNVADAKQRIVDQRLEVTKNLLLNAKPDTITLQIKSVLSQQSSADKPLTDDLLKLELDRLSQQLEIDNIYLYRTHQKGEIYTVILYGAFTQRADALNKLKDLPAPIKNTHPYLRTFAGVKKDIEQGQ